MSTIKNYGWVRPENQWVECLTLIICAKIVDAEVLWTATVCVKPNSPAGEKTTKTIQAKALLDDVVLKYLDIGIFPLPRMSGKHHYLGWKKQKELRNRAMVSDVENHYIPSDKIFIWDWDKDEFGAYARMR